MDKLIFKTGIIIIIIVEVILISINDDFRYFDIVPMVDYFIEKLCTVLAFYLIMRYNYIENEKYNVNDTIFFVSAIISGISLAFIFKIVITLSYIFEELSFINSYNIVESIFDAINFYSFSNFMEKNAAIYISLIVIAYINYKQEKVVKDLRDNHDTAVSYDDYDTLEEYYEDQIKIQYENSFDEAPVKARSKKSGIKAGFIIIFCQALFGILVLFFHMAMNYF